MQYQKGISPRKPSRRRIRSFSGIILLSKVLKALFILLLIMVVVSPVFVILISSDLPTPGKLSSGDIHDSTKIFDRNNNLLFSIYKEYNRTYVSLTQVPEYLKVATIVIEDADFYVNKGFSLRGYARALRDFILFGKVSGGSTITQQLVKNVLLTPERSIQRKLKELILALQVERRYPKNQILEMYLNNVSYGGTALGVETASDLYFGKSVRDLTLGEAAFLAGLPQAPSYYSPLTGKNKAYIVRTKDVLRRMHEEGYISAKQVEEAGKEVDGMVFMQRKGAIRAPHFVMFVREQLVKLFGEDAVEKGNLTVRTTLDYPLQEKTEEIVFEELEKIKKFRVGNGAAVVLAPQTGEILAMVGSKDYFDIENDGNFNAATAFRQPGSALKPIMYAVAFEKGYTPATVLMDAQTDFPTLDPLHPIYTPQNYDGKYRGSVQIRFALGNSINVPAVKMLARVGIKPVMQKAYDMGIKNWKPTDENLKDVGLSLVLGGRETSLLEIASAYAVFANGGVRREPFGIVEVRDGKGKVLYKHEDSASIRVIMPEIAFLVSHILLDNNARQPVFGPFSALVVPGKTVAVKTGTTDKKRDNWTIGYTPTVVVGTWVGNNDNSPMNPQIASGVTGATPIWNKIMQRLLKDKQDQEFTKPDNVEAHEIDAYLGGMPVEGHERRSEYFIKGTQPLTPSPFYKKLKLSKHQPDKLANQDEISHGDYEVKEYIVFYEQDPVSKDGENRWQKGIDEWLKSTYSAADQKYYPPTQTSDHKYEEPKPTSTPVLTATPSPTLTPSETPTPTLSPTP